jgi:enoyl-CoA hydratase/carnithine racemase
MPVSLVEYELSDHIAVIRLNRPERLNAMSAEMRAELTEIGKRFNADDDAWVGILTGTGRSFCAGRDMKAQAEGFATGGGKLQGRVYTPENNMFGLFDTMKPMIAAVNGFAIGMGWYMTINCDIRIAAAGAKFGMTELPTGALGPYWFAAVEVVPWPVAVEFTLYGEQVTAERLLSLNLLNAVVPAEELMAEARRWAERLVKLPPVHIRKTKELMLATRGTPGQDLLTKERAIRGVLADLNDSREAVEAWTQRRPGNFTGT